MKQQYEAPTVLLLGSFAQLTGIQGDPHLQDFVYNSSGVVVAGPIPGSPDADPCGVPSDPECGEGL